MKKFYKYIVLFFSLILPSNSILSSILPKTLIRTSSGLVAIEDLHIGDYVTSFDFDTESFINIKITNISKKEIDTIVIIETNQGTVYAPKGQFFADPRCDDWIEAQDLTAHNRLACYGFYYVECLTIELLNFPTCIYEISVEDPHVFFYSDYQILTHNFANIAYRVVFTLIEQPEVFKKILTTMGTILTGLFTRKMLTNCTNNKKAINHARQQVLEYTKQYIKKNSFKNVGQAAIQAHRTVTDFVKSQIANGNIISLPFCNLEQETCTNKPSQIIKKAVQDSTKKIFKELVKNVHTVKVGNYTIVKPKGMKLSKCLGSFNIPHDTIKTT